MGAIGTHKLVELTLLSVLVLAGLGFYDDYAKIIQQSGGGTPPRVKLWAQIALACFYRRVFVGGAFDQQARDGNHGAIFQISVVDECGLARVPIVVLAIVGSSNAVNLTDGLDGLAIGCTLIVAFVFLVFTYLAGNFKAAAYLQIPYVDGAGELTVFCAALIGAGLGLFVVQLPSGAGFHGRHRFARHSAARSASSRC